MISLQQANPDFSSRANRRVSSKLGIYLEHYSYLVIEIVRRGEEKKSRKEKKRMRNGRESIHLDIVARWLERTSVHEYTYLYV